MYVLTQGSQVVKFPYSLADLKNDHPNVSFPSPLRAEDLSEFGVYEVKSSEFSYDPLTQEIEEGHPSFDEASGQWVQSWIVTDIPAEEKLQRLLLNANYRGFYDALISSAVYQKIRGQAVNSLPLTVAATEFIAAMTDAKTGRANKDALQACFDNIIEAASLDPSDVASIQAMLVDAKMDKIYSVGA